IPLFRKKLPLTLLDTTKAAQSQLFERKRADSLVISWEDLRLGWRAPPGYRQQTSFVWTGRSCIRALPCRAACVRCHRKSPFEQCAKPREDGRSTRRRNAPPIPPDLHG